jgi:hypothetical protein
MFFKLLNLGHGSREFLKTRNQTSVILENTYLRELAQFETMCYIS